LVSDIELVDDFPASVLTHTRRQHRWVRGDWQILMALLPVVATPAGLRRNLLSLISRWKILDNLRRSLVAPALFLLLLLAWTGLPGSPLGWTIAVLAVLGFPLLPELARLGIGPRSRQPLRAFLQDVGSDIQRTGAHAVVQAALLP